MESARSSTVALFAVPKRNQPGQPKLVLRKLAPTLAMPAGAIQVIAIPGAGPTAAGFRVFRVRSEALLSDVDRKGPPKIQPEAPGWADFTLERLDGGPGEQGRAIADPVPESWYPYYYQVVAIGQENLTAGEYKGESIPSAVMPGYLPPINPPTLGLVSFVGNATNRVLTFRTSLPIRLTPLGTASLEVRRIKPSSDGTRFERESVLSTRVHEISEGPALTVLATPSDAQLDAMPEINRGARGYDGLTEFTVRMRADVERGAVVALDPLGRRTEISFPEVP
jgi:hypothetical protein